MNETFKRNVEMIISELPEDGAAVSITNLTERCWGTSGRGNPTVAGMIRACIDLGIIKIERRGRRSFCSRRPA